MPEAASTPTPRAPPPARSNPRRGRWGRGIVLALLFVALVLAALGFSLRWVVRSEAGSAWLLAHVPGVRASGVRGALLGDFDVRQLDVDLPGDGALSLSELAWRGLRIEPTDGPAWFRIVFDKLSATRIDVRVGNASAAGPAARPAAPTELVLPIELVIDALQVGTVHATALGDTPLRDLRARIHLGAEGGARHRIDDIALNFDRLRARASLALGSRAPLPLTARVDLEQEGALAGTQFSARASLDGPLAAPQLMATLRARAAAAGATPPVPQSLDLAAGLRPFDAWPLGDVRAQAQAFDLSALLPGAPATSLSGEIQARSQGMDQPATLTLSLANGAPGRWNEARVPLRKMAIELRGRPDDPATLDLPVLDIELGNREQAGGRITGRGDWKHGAWTLDATLSDLQPAQLDARAAPMRIGGPLRVRGSTAAPTRVDIKAELQGQVPDGKALREVQLQLDAGWRSEGGAQHIELRQVQATAGGAHATLTGTATRAAGSTAWHLKGQTALADFDPRPWWPGPENSAWRKGPHRLNAKGDFDLTVPGVPAAPPGSAAQRAGVSPPLPALSGRAALSLADSLLAGVPLSGKASLRSDPGAPARAEVELVADGNRLHAEGRLATRPGASDDAWDLSLAAPALAKLAPLSNLLGNVPAANGLVGALEADAKVTGRWPDLSSSGQARLSALRLGTVTLQRAEARWQLGTRMDTPVDAQITLGEAAVGQATLESARLTLTGTGRAHRLELRAESKATPPPWAQRLQASAARPGAAASAPAPAPAPPGPATAVLTAQGGLYDGPGGAVIGWRGNLQDLAVGQRDAAPWVRTREVGMELQWAGAGAVPRATLQPGRAEILGAALRWSRIAWQAGQTGAPAQLDAQAELEPVAVAPLLARLQPDFGWGGDLALTGRLEVHSAPTFKADIVLERSRGDLTVTDETGTQGLGLTDLRLALNAADGVWNFTQGLAGATLGVAAGAVVARTSPQASWPAADTPIQGVLELQVANLGTWGTWVPAGWRLGGALRVGASISGTFGAPEYTGEVSGKNLTARNFLQGVNVSDGEVLVKLQGASARIEKFSARGGAGTVKLSGDAAFGETPQAQLSLVAEKFQLLGRVDRRIVASGQAQLRLQREALTLNGKFGVDEGLIDFTRSDAPSLSSDVTVIRAPRDEAARAAAKAESSSGAFSKAVLDLRVNLGERLRLRGRGLDTGLRGELHITSPDGRLAVNGTVRTEGGNFAAYGQKLKIDRGNLGFNGPVDNPRLDIEATRPGLDIRVGVAVSGTAVEPRVRLFSEPELSEVDKLSWLVLGRASEGLGRTDTALLQRAALALLSGEGEGKSDQFTRAIGLDELSLRQSDGEVKETIVSLGKQLSQRWYVGYERSLSATTGNWQLIYRIAQRFTLRAQAGGDSALDLIWTWRWQ